MKKMFFLFFVLFFSCNAFASIENYFVTPSVPLGKTLTIYGILNPAVANVTCNFTIFDDQNAPVKFLNDIKTPPSGIVRSNYLKIEEPITGGVFFRGFDYNVVTNCDGNISSATMRVAQRETYAHAINQEADFLGKQGNQESFFAILIFGGLLILAGGILLWGWKRGQY